MTIGRPSVFTEELADEICTRLANGESLRTICNSERDDFIPSIGTVMRWVVENEKFREHYEEARRIQAETMADEIVTIADGSPYADPSPVDVARDRLRVDARKWVASKLLPKKYGDKIAHVGGDPESGDRPIQAVTRIELVAGVRE